MDSEPITLQLPIPNKKLARNCAGGWKGKFLPIRKARLAANWEAQRALNAARRAPPRWARAKFTATLFHLTAQTPDPTNFMDSLKPYIDGIADAKIVLNDRDLWPERPKFLRVDKMPRVEITIEPDS